MPVDRAVALAEAWPAPAEQGPSDGTFDGRHRLADGPIQVWALDSASLVRATDAGAILATGSHGGLVGGRPETALKVDALAALFNDAGGGAGTARLGALEARGIAAATVGAGSARIGDGRSTYEDGVLSAVNDVGRALGARPGLTARTFTDLVRVAADGAEDGR
jgi:hypothetical protein